MRAKWIGVAAVLAGAGAYFAQQVIGIEPLPRWIPDGAQVYLEAKDFGGLLREWNSSAEKRAWIGSANHSVFSKSRLYLRLAQAREEFAAASGLGVDSALLDQLAGGRSALAIYDIGKLEFLYVTKLAAAPALQAVAGQFTSRSVAGSSYAVKSAADSGRTTAFAIQDGWLLLATSESHLARALQLMSGQGGGALANESWFQRAAQTQGEIRLAANLEMLSRSPHFRSYWVQRNGEEFRGMEGAIADLTRQPSGWVEHRTLVRKQPLAPGSSALLQEVARAVPNDAGYYRLALGAPQASVLALPGAARFVEEQDGEDLETLVDVTPFTSAGRSNEAALTDLLRNGVAHAVIRGTRLQQDQVFIAPLLGVVVRGQSPWNAAAVRSLLPGFSVAVVGNLLYAANHEPLLRAMQAGGTVAVPEEKTVYLAGFRHGAERGRLFQMLGLIDGAGATPAEQPEDRVPEFFSENVASFSRALVGFTTASVSRQDEGEKVTETVRYLRQP